MKLEDYIKKHKNDFDDKKMPEALTNIFENRLKKELHQSNPAFNRKFISYLSIAASLVLMFALGYFYNKNNNEKRQARNELVLSLNEESASHRLEAVYEIEEEFKEEDERVLNRFYELLHNDSNANVKMAIIDALLKHPNNQYMRLQLIKALEQEKEPLVQHKLIESLTLLRETRAKQPLQKIIDDKEALPSVKGSASASLAMLNQ